jgi:DNA-binding MarR family transcriptional regulator
LELLLDKSNNQYIINKSNSLREIGILMFRPNLKIIKVTRLGLSFAGQKLKDIDLSSGLFHFMAELSRHEWLNMSELCNAVGVDNAYTSRSVEKLIALGYGNRVQDEQDRRAFHVSLTGSGWRIAKRINKDLNQWVEIITAGVSPKEIATVNRVFDRFHRIALRHMK